MILNQVYIHKWCEKYHFKKYAINLKHLKVSVVHIKKVSAFLLIGACKCVWMSILSRRVVNGTYG